MRKILVCSFAGIAMSTAAAAALAADAGIGGEAVGMTEVAMLLLYMSLALIFSFLCSVAEAVLLSVTPSFIAGLQKRDPGKADLLQRLKQKDVDRSLAAILTLNTIAHTVGAIGSGAKATVVFGSAWIGLFSALMTLMILFLSEIIPKTIGAVYWRALAGVTAVFVQWLIFLLYPLILISERLTRLISHGADIHVFSRDEFVAMAGVGEEAGALNERESRIIRNLFKFERIKANDIMTPRVVLFGLPQDMTVEEAQRSHPDTPFSRIPIFERDLDSIVGFVLKDDLLLRKAQHQGETKLLDLRREIATVEATMPVSDLLEFFLDHRQHIALVRDEYGGTAGLVTLEDVVETLFGLEIVDEMDRVEDMQALARKQWARRAGALGLQVDKVEEAARETATP